MSSISHRYFTSAKFVFHHVLFAGEYLALTGEKLNGVEMIACGLATHYSLSAVRPLGLFSLSKNCFLESYQFAFKMY